jgi:hypothetical protein
MMNLVGNKVIIIAACIAMAASFYTGWRVKGAFAAEAENAELKAQAKFVEEFKSFESKISDNLELKLQDLRANERVIEREKIKVIENNPVTYNVECFDIAGVRLLEQARIGKADAIKPTD